MYAKRSLGQNFLVDSSYVKKIVDALRIRPGDTILEIGSGRGALTGELLERRANVLAVEIDRSLIPELSDRFGSLPGFRLIEADFLEIDIREILGEKTAGVKVAANLPYYISTPILRKLFDFRKSFSELVVMLQKEVAERITAPPGDSARGYLTVLIERGFTSEMLFDVPPGAFRPVPKVQSSVIRLAVRDGIDPRDVADQHFASLASAGFSQKRKTLRNNLRAAGKVLRDAIMSAGGPEYVLRASGIDPDARAEQLTLSEWNALARAIFSSKPDEPA